MCPHAHTHAETGCTILYFFNVQIGNISQDFPEYRFHGKKLLLVSGSHSQHSPPYLAIIIMNCGEAMGPRHPEKLA